MLCVSAELGVRFVVQLLLLSPVLWSFLCNIEDVFTFSFLFLVFCNNITVPVTLSGNSQAKANLPGRDTEES